VQDRPLWLVNFRGFKEAQVVPRGHVLLVGEPRAGRSDIIEALRRVFQPDSTRFPLTEPLDFHAGNVAQRAGAMVVIGDLGPELEQRFFDQLEVWDSESNALVPELGLHDALEAKNELVVRLCHRAEWNTEEKVGEHWVDFPKFSDPGLDRGRTPSGRRRALLNERKAKEPAAILRSGPELAG
jgi:putative ATP-dependent endonuclease of the OLD family